MNPRSDNLFHFTKSIDVLKLILKNGIYPRYCFEDVEWFDFKKHKQIAFPMCCFCDIPLSRIQEHTSFYGKYGLGFTKEWGITNGLNPVVYSPYMGVAQNLMKHLFYLKIPDPIVGEELLSQSYKLFSLLKPLKGKMNSSEGEVEKDFHQENEWRYVPPVDSMIVNDSISDDNVIPTANAEAEKFKLEFIPSDIRYIFVENDADIPELVDFINSELDHFLAFDLKIMLTRIVSLETLRRDI